MPLGCLQLDQSASKKLSGLDDEEERRDFYLIISQMALICIASFDVDEKHLRIVLTDTTQMRMMIHSSVIIQNLSHSVGACTEPFYINLALQKQRVLYNSYGFILTETLEKICQGPNLAVKSALPFYNEGGVWKLLSDIEYHWLEKKTVPRNGKVSLPIQINILTGELLVNGLPPSRLPTLYEEHPVFRELFGRELIEVMPSDIPGTIFSSMKSYHGYNFAFGMDDSEPPQLVIVASANDEILDLIPRRILNNNLPASFIDDYVHWYNRQSGMVEFRPAKSAWCSSDSNWPLRDTGSAWVLKRPGQTLICPTSSTIKRICQNPRSLEEETYIHIIRDNTTFALNISLPRLRLDFSLEQGSSGIHRRQFRGMYVDKVQQIGTLVSYVDLRPRVGDVHRVVVKVNLDGNPLSGGLAGG
ncbi:very large low complexity [Trichoderma arundinaceum]|uniref:Very large low complexity n=1 Tax=Trichoderma arundinaceum TaxID=490622 RepID=A0A395N885_TRIAR|nr:very large low complexity [Trichoderma arundinaceum]